MARKIQHKRGLKQDLPQLDNAEIGYTTDTKEIYIGSKEGNQKVAMHEDVESQIGAVEQGLQTHVDNKNNPHGTTKTHVGLGNVDNVQQASKVEFDGHVNQKSTTSKEGHVQLNDSTSSSSTTQAATANAVKKAFDRAVSVNSEQLNVIELPKVTDFPTEYKNGVSVTFFVSTSENGTGWSEGVGYEGSAARYGIITTFKSTSSNGFQKVVLYNLGGSAFEEFTRTATTTTNRWSPFRKSVTSDDFIKGAGNPEGTVTAPKGTLYLRTDGGTDTTLYVKTSGTGNVGWTAK